jgi:multidrug efflux system membrane fusion protein
MKNWIIAILAASTIGSTWGAPPPSAGAKGPRSITVEVRPVEERAVAYRIQTTGSLETDEWQATCEVAGAVRTLSFEEGDEVTPDQVLAEIDPERYRLLEARAKAAFQQAGARLSEARSALERRRKLHQRNAGWVPEEELVRLEAAFDAAQAEELQARAEWDLATEDLRRCRLRAPAAGRIERRQIALGRYVTPGTSAATILDTRRLRMRFQVTELEATRLSIGRPITFLVRSRPDEILRGRIFHIAGRTDPASRAVTCVAHVDNPHEALRAGTFAEIEIETGREEKALAVPESAVLPTERGYVAFVVEEGTARRRQITLGLHLTDGDIEVTHGLRAGEALVTRGAHLLSDGAAVEIISGE